VQFEGEADEEQLENIKKNIDKGYLLAISPDKITNEIKDFRWLETRNASERQQL
jgi:hypothetical protein